MTTTTFTPGMVIPSTWLNATDATVAGALQGATTAAGVRSAIGAMAPSDQFTGSLATGVTGVTQTSTDSSTKIATTAFVRAASPKSFAYINTVSNLAFNSATFANLDTTTSANINLGSCYSAGVFTVPYTGYIQVQVAQMSLSESVATVTYLETRVKQNATAQNPSHYAYPKASKADAYALNVILPVTAGDTIELVSKVVGGGTASVSFIGISFQML